MIDPLNVPVHRQVTEISGFLTASAGAVQEALSDYRAQREAVSKLLPDGAAAKGWAGLDAAWGQPSRTSAERSF